MTAPQECGIADSTANKTVLGNQTIPPFGDKRAVAAMLGLSVRTVDNFLANGMPHIKFGARRCRFDMEEVRAWIKEKYGQRRRGPLNQT